ncbi:MAG: Tyrosine-specific transport protein [Candidatus Anoxychlamydiales bacterium]|nr:Tyrosine-specific transport protein [Candidatus Anoxychlamydiales bacterium]
MKKNINDIISGTFLIAGTLIGAGMLGIPSVTGQTGFLPAIVISVAIWLYMLFSGWLFLEATLWMHKDANILSMTKRFLGNKGKLLAGLTFIFLYYCLMIAYIDAGAPLFMSFVNAFLGIKITGWMTYAIFTLIIGVIIGFGIHVIDKINYILVIVLVITYVLLVSGQLPDIEFTKLTYQNWSLTPFAAPILFASFGYHNIIPSLTFHFKENAKTMRYSIFFGSFLALIIYLFWQLTIIGIVPTNELETIYREGGPITQTIQILSQKQWIRNCIKLFGISALATSFLGVSFSVIDFLGDGLNLKRTGKHRFVLVLLTLIPPFIITSYNPSIFLLSFGLAGGFGEAFLNGILPAWLVWIGRYKNKLKSKHMLIGGKIMLGIIILIGLIVMGIEIKILLHH